MMPLNVATLSIHTGRAAALQSKVEQDVRAGQGAGTLSRRGPPRSAG